MSTPVIETNEQKMCLSGMIHKHFKKDTSRLLTLKTDVSMSEINWFNKVSQLGRINTLSGTLTWDLEDMLEMMERRTTRYLSRLMAVRNQIADRPATRERKPYISHPVGIAVGFHKINPLIYFATYVLISLGKQCAFLYGPSRYVPLHDISLIHVYTFIFSLLF